MSETTVYNQQELKYIGNKHIDKEFLGWLISDEHINTSKVSSFIFEQFQQFPSFINDYMKDVYIPDETLSQEQQNVIQEIIKDLFEAIEFDKEYLEEEGLELPNKEVINKAINLIYLLSNEDIFPKETTTTVEEGICLIFEDESFHLYLELYNHGEIGYMLENSKTNELIENEIYVSLSDVKSKISQLFS
mgnify:FL=1